MDDPVALRRLHGANRGLQSKGKKTVSACTKFIARKQARAES